MTVDPALVALPLALVGILTFAMQYLKPLIERIPGCGPNYAAHDANLRIAFWLLAFVAIGAYVWLTLPAPTTPDTWIDLAYRIGNTAGLVTLGGHILYKKVSGGSSAPAAPTPPMFPPGAPSIAALGLPSVPEAA